MENVDLNATSSSSEPKEENTPVATVAEHGQLNPPKRFVHEQEKLAILPPQALDISRKTVDFLFVPLYLKFLQNNNKNNKNYNIKLNFTTSQNISKRNAAMNLKDEYDIIFYLSPEGVELEDNSIRTTDATYRSDIDFQIKKLLERFPPKKLVNIPPYLTTEERIKEVVKHIYNSEK
jgi:hypothetical protein